MNSILLGGFVALMATGLPIAIAMCLGSLLYIWISGTIPPLTVVHRMVGGVDSFPLLAVPFFILAGALMNSAGITNRIYNFALALVGWLKGGLGHVNVVGSVIFAGMSGTAIADAGGLGTIEIKAMQDHGYPTEFALGITAASATLGPIIPPSLPMVIYGVQANVSIGKLFAAGFIPGALMALFMMVMVAYYAHVRKYGSDIAFSWPRMGRAFFELVFVAITAVGLFYLWSHEGLPGWLRFGGLLVATMAADKIFKFEAYMALLTPVILIGGMSTGL
ncbi:MAG: TRAP transporter large permease, partial [Casimicrobiaceae bacterium]